MQFYHYLIEAKSFLRQTIEILEREKRKIRRVSSRKNDYTNN